MLWTRASLCITCRLSAIELNQNLFVGEHLDLLKTGTGGAFKECNMLCGTVLSLRCV
jgi:hypothetical protein